jgi:hypothetical protein
MTTALGIALMVALGGIAAGACFALSHRFWETLGIFVMAGAALLGARIGWQIGSGWSWLAGLVDAWLGAAVLVVLVLWIAHATEPEQMRDGRWER